MAEDDRILGMCLHLARASSQRQRPLVRDKLLLLAGVKAQEMGLPEISDLCRHKILAHNPRHLVRQWPSLSTALADDDFQVFLKQVRRHFSPEKIEHMVESLGIEMGRERETYFSDLEYAAALLDTRPEAIGDILRSRVSAPSQRTILEPAFPPELKGRPATLTNLLVVWGPWLAGVVVLAALAVWWRVGVH